MGDQNSILVIIKPTIMEKNWSPSLWHSKFFIAKLVVTKKFPSPHDWQQNAFSCQTCNDQKHFVTNNFF
jgi:hypothetical protein